MGLPFSALQNAKDVKTLKAVSQNLMHSNLSITDGVYGVLSENDIKEQITSLGQNLASDVSQDMNYFIPVLEQFIKTLKNNAQPKD